MTLLNPDANNYLGPANAADTTNPTYPRWMYHPTKGSTIVADANSEGALVASDSQWSEIDTSPTT